MTLKTKADCVNFLKQLSKLEKAVFPGYADLIFKMSERLSESNFTEEVSISEIRSFLVKEASEATPSEVLIREDIGVAKCIAENIAGFSKVN